MVLQYNPASIPLIFSVFILIVIIFVAIDRRHIPGVKSFIWLLICVIEWTTFYAIAISVPEPHAQIVWTKYYFIGIVFVPYAWLVFSLEYSRMTSLLTRRNLLFLACIPILIIILIWTNDYHHIIWTDNIIRQTDQGLIVDYPSANAWGFTVLHTGYSYLFIAAGSLLLVRQALSGPTALGSQTAMMVIGAIFPLVANLLYNYLLAQYVKLDPTPYAMAGSGLFYAWGLFRLGLFDILPVAGEVVLEGLQEGIMVLDRTDHVVYVNPAFVDYSGVSTKAAIGSTAAKMLARWPELIEEFRHVTNTSTKIAVKVSDDITRHFEIRISPLLDYGRRNIGRVFIMQLIDNPTGTRALDLTSATARRKLLLMTMMANGEVVAVNEHFVGILGYTRAEIIEKSAIKIWQSGEQRSSTLRKIRSEGLENMELNLVAKDGHIVNLIASAKSLTINEETYLFFAMREKR